MRIQLAKETPDIIGEVKLPPSKSISNRLLILNSLATRPGELGNLSDSDDTLVMQAALKSRDEVIDIGHAGTAMRFLTAYFSIKEGRRILTGSQRMQNRPIGQLVDALKDAGAEISYLDRKGYPPLRIRGKKIRGGQISIDSSISSQFISALMMIAPSLEEGLTIQLVNEMVSSSYIRLTMKLMRDFGLSVEFSGNTIGIPPASFKGVAATVESDWSAAGYWYALAALSDNVHLRLSGLKQASYQGDSVLAELFRPFGVVTGFSQDGVMLSRDAPAVLKFEYDFTDNPDLVQTMAVVCGLTARPFSFTGTRTLLIKETDRIRALGMELQKLGIVISADPEGRWIRWDGNRRCKPAPEPLIRTYEDHRMAMAFAPACMKFPHLAIEDPDVVRKSYPGFWEDLAGAGFEIREG